MRKSSRGLVGLLAASTFVSAQGCRESGPAPRQRPSAAAPEPAPPVVGEPGAGADEAERATAEGVEAGAAARAGGGLSRVTAEQLLGDVRAGAKQATLVNAWASWCGPCRREIPMLQALSVNLRPQGVEIVLVSVDDAKDEAKALSFLKDNDVTLKSYLADGDLGAFKAGINPRWPGMLPASFLFDARGKLVHFWAGEAFENEIVSVVEDFLAGRPIERETRYGLAPGKLEQ